MDRQSLGVALVLVGSPIIYFLRDGLSIAPGNFYFTGLLMTLYLSLLFDLRKNIYKPNVSLLCIASIFWASSLVYFIYSDYQEKTKDIFYIIFLLFFFIGLLKLKDDKVNNIITAITLVTFLSNLLFIVFFKFFFFDISLRTIGSRAYIGGEEGNPNLYANIAYLGIISSYFFMKKQEKNIRTQRSYKRFIFLIFAIMNIILSVFVIILTQNRTVLIALIFLLIFKIIIGMFSSLLNGRISININMTNVKKSFFILISSFITLIIVFFSFKDIYIDYYYNYAQYFQGLIENIKGGSGDLSSMQRILSFHLVKIELENNPESYILGKGYKYEWLDIPILQAIRDLGIFGLSFLILHLFLIIYILRIIFLNHNIENKIDLKFLSSLYILELLNSLSHGQPYDLSHWIPLLILIRFFKIRYKIKNIKHFEGCKK